MLTIKDIAAKLNLDHSTVSRILNGRTEKYKYRPETIELVKAYAAGHGFRKNSVASALKSGRAGLIGVTVPDVGNPFFGKLASLIDFELNRHGYRMLLANGGDSIINERKNLEAFLSYRVDGIIYSPSRQLPFDMLRNTNIPVITVDNCLSDELPFVGLDNDLTFGILASFIRTKGYKSTGIICYDSGLEREKAFLKQNSGSLKVISAPRNCRQDETCRDQIEWLLQNDCDVLAGTSEQTTLKLLDYFGSNEIDTGQGPAVTGFRDTCLMDYVGTKLTGIRQPVEKYADTAVRILLDAIDGKQASQAKIMFPGELIIKSSL
ncbi:MAG: LacI family DNA-binding transcriptional regulator [Victivallaceae bacterium]|jgi:LacI family transcriptional regulator